MRLLFDQNLSRHLVVLLADLYPGSAHTGHLGLDRAPDSSVWNWAAERGVILVTKDSDFHQLSLVRGAPPKVVWIRLGNASTRQVAELLRQHAADVHAFAEDSAAVFLALG